MRERISALWSEYIIDGVRMDVTPGAMLTSACGRETGREEKALYDTVIDESVDPAPVAMSFDSRKAVQYMQLIRKASHRDVPLGQVASYTRSVIARSLIETIWRTGHFRLDDLAVTIKWKYNPDMVGCMAALYESVEAACGYIEEIGIKMDNFVLSESATPAIEASAGLASSVSPGDPEEFEEDAADNVSLSRKRKCGSASIGTPDDWIIYIPFDTCDFRLGGSMLAQVTGNVGGIAPEVNDPQYFADCFEVVRELVEDGVVTAGVTVGDGGLMRAMTEIIPKGRSMDAEISGIMKSYDEKDMARILFAEVPGAIIEIKDADYDYIDAELLLQDVAYYPLGHPGKSSEGVKVSVSDISDVSGILQSLLSGQASEGED